MNLRNSLAGLLLVAAVGGLGYVAYRVFVAPVHGCDVCGREIHAGMHAAASLENGRRVDACCARCVLHFAAGKADEIARVTVEDHGTREPIEATTAVYVEASDVEGCASHGDSTPREPGVTYERIFDRCVPTLVAFRTQADAHKFQRQHGGRLITFTQALESVRNR